MKPKRVWRDLEISEVSLVSAGANQPAFVTLFKSKGAGMKCPECGSAMSPGEKCPKCGASEAKKSDSGGQTCRGCNTSVEAADKYCRGCGAPFYKRETMDENQKIEKALADAKAEMQKAFDAEREKLAKEAEARESALKAKIAEQARVEKKRDAVERVGKLFKSVPAQADELADKLVEIEEKAPEVAKYFEEILGKCSVAIAEGELLKQKADAQDPVGGDDVLAQVDKKVAEKLASNPKLTKHQAEAEVWRENRDLYSKYLAAQQQAE